MLKLRWLSVEPILCLLHQQLETQEKLILTQKKFVL